MMEYGLIRGGFSFIIVVVIYLIHTVYDGLCAKFLKSILYKMDYRAASFFFIIVVGIYLGIYKFDQFI